MKKSTRILAFLMAFAMLIGSFSVMGSAYEAYKGAAIKNSYNDIDTPVFSTEQGASMALDEVDRMLAKEQIYLNVYVGELDLRSVNYAITSIDNLLGKASSLLGLLGSAADLTIDSLKVNGKPMQRSTATDTSGNVTDVKFITNLLDFLGDNAGIFEQYVNGTFSLGILNGIVADFIFDARELVIGLGYSLTEAGKDFDPMEDDFETLPDEFKDPNNGAITLVQLILNQFVLGDWVKLDEYFDEPWKTANTRYDYYSFADDYGETEPNTADFDYYGYKHPDEWVLVGLGGCVRVPEGDPAPDPVYDAVKVTGNIDGYTFIENLLQRAFNYLLVPVLNNQTRHALREWCGVIYDEKYTQRTKFDEATNTWIENEFYNPLYSGEPFNPDETGTVYNTIFNVDAKMDKVTVPAGKTLISQINDIFGNFLGARADGTKSTTGILLSEAYVPFDEFSNGTVGDWTWQFGSNSYLFTNIVNVAKYILQITGRMLFADYVEVPSAEVIEGYNDQQVVAFILRSIFNGSVDWMFIPNDAENQTILGVAYSAVEQLAYQDIPQYTYTRPMIADYTGNISGYYDALIEKGLDILLDVAVFNLNQSFDANPASGSKAGEGLIPYQGDDGSWENTAIMVAKWAVNEYGPLLAIYKNLHTGGKNTANLTMENVWTDIDTILNSLIPIVGTSAWINSEISGKKFTSGDSAVAKNFIFEYILKPVYTLDATNFSKIFDKNTSADAAFGTKNGVQIIANILDNVFDLLFPNVFSNAADTVDKVLTNSTLAAMIHDLLKSLGTREFDGKANSVKIQGRANDIAKVALPVVNMLLGLSDEQEFEEMEIFLPEVITVGKATTFSVYNGSSGINTAYTSINGEFSQDTLYEYTVSSITAKAYHAAGGEANLSYTGIGSGTKFSGGDNVNVVLAPDGITNGDIIEFSVNYTVSGEEANTTIGGSLTKTVYAYAGSSAKGDDELDKEIPLSDGRTILYTSDIYLDQGDDLDDIEGYSIRIQDNESQIDWVDPNKDENGNPISQIAPTVNVVKSGAVDNTGAPFAGTSTEANVESLTGQDGLYFLYPFKLATKADGSFYERYEDFYQVDAEGNVVIDETTKKPVVTGNNGGVVDGDYVVTVPVTVYDAAGTNVVETKEVEIRIHLYDDFDLPGAFSSAAAKNRQQSEYKCNDGSVNISILYNNYTSALKNAAKLALTPKSGDNFMTFIGMNDTSDAYVNYYEQRAIELETAIAALEEWKVAAGVDSIKNIIKGLDGYNYEDRTFQATVDGETYTFHYQVPIEYYQDGYVFFGERNYIPYLYDRYRDARGNGQDLVNSQEIFVKAPFTDADVYGADYKPSEDEIAEYNASLAAAIERIKNPVIVGSTEAAYAEHMLTLTSKRLVALEANKSKLNATIEAAKKDLAGNTIDLATGGSKYTTESWGDYYNAMTFATKVNAKSTSDAIGTITSSCTNPVEVNVAMSELVESWKKLIEGNNFSVLDAEIAASADYINKEADYTPETFSAFKALYDEAVAFDRESLKSDETQDKIDALAADLKAAREGLKDAAAAEPTWEFVTAVAEDKAEYFKDLTGTRSFVPTLTSKTTNKYQVSYFDGTPVAQDNVTPIDDFIIGTGANLNEAALLSVIDSASLNNCYVKAVKNSDRGYSTGALLQVYSSANDSVIATYQVICFGNIIGENRFNVKDVNEIKFYNAGVTAPYVGMNACAKKAAMDTNNDGRINTRDVSNFKYANSSKGTFDQLTGKFIAL